jgi:hypothetical protein
VSFNRCQALGYGINPEQHHIVPKYIDAFFFENGK